MSRCDRPKENFALELRDMFAITKLAGYRL
jgi:hypothetical protein